MILIPCPYCGLRNSNEFAYLGESRSRPVPGDGIGHDGDGHDGDGHDGDGVDGDRVDGDGVVDRTQWRAYLYTRRNRAGWTNESWFHRYGCRRLIVAERHTVTNEVRSTRLAADDEPS